MSKPRPLSTVEPASFVNVPGVGVGIVFPGPADAVTIAVSINGTPTRVPADTLVTVVG